MIDVDCFLQAQHIIKQFNSLTFNHIVLNIADNTALGLSASILLYIVWICDV